MKAAILAIQTVSVLAVIAVVRHAVERCSSVDLPPSAHNTLSIDAIQKDRNGLDKRSIPAAQVPHSELPFGLTDRGKYTLSNYIMHPMVLMILATWLPLWNFCYEGFTDNCTGPYGKGWFGLYPGWNLYALLLLAVVLGNILATRTAFRLFKIILDPPVEVKTTRKPPTLRFFMETLFQNLRPRVYFSICASTHPCRSATSRR